MSFMCSSWTFGLTESETTERNLWGTFKYSNYAKGYQQRVLRITLSNFKTE